MSWIPLTEDEWGYISVVVYFMCFMAYIFYCEIILEFKKQHKNE